MRAKKDKKRVGKGRSVAFLLMSMPVFILVGCPAMGVRTLDEEDLYKPLPKPTRMEASGTFIHSPSEMEFPEKVGELERTNLLRYDKNGFDVSAGYRLKDSKLPFDLTVYVFPEREHHKVRQLTGGITLSSSEVRGKLDRRFQKLQKDLKTRYPFVKEVSSGNSLLLPGKMGRKVIYTFKKRTPTRVLTAETTAHLYFFQNGWFMKYRVTYDSDLERAGDILKKFAREIGVPRP